MSINDFNLYAHCNNNLVNYSDKSGNFPIAAHIIGICIGILAGGLSAVIHSYREGNRGKILFVDIFGVALIGGA